MKKNAFTLSEILIALGIIGVIAALTMPRLAAFNENKANAMILKSTIATVENAFGRAIMEENVEDLFETSFGKAADNPSFAGNLGKYLNISGFDEINDNTLSVTLKNGAVISIKKLDKDEEITEEDIDKDEEITEEDMIDKGTTLYQIFAEINIDTNGTKKLNRDGRDVFYFYVNQDGKLYPYGGKDMNLFNNEIPLWSSACGDEITDEKACTGRLIDNNYEFDY